MSAVYPEARADFDATLIRLHASPAPLSRTIVKGAALSLVPLGEKTLPVIPNARETDADGTPDRFLTALKGQFGAVEARLWLADAQFERLDEEWVLRLPSRFKADWVRSKLSHMLDQAAKAAGLDRAPNVLVRTA